MLYSAGGWLGEALGLGIGGGGVLRGGLRIEWGNWKIFKGGPWQFPPGKGGWHWHWGNAPGLQKHHLPYQIQNWLKNFISKVKDGEAQSDIANVLAALYGAAQVLAGRGCAC
jgi:hypothetical protein